MEQAEKAGQTAPVRAAGEPEPAVPGVGRGDEVAVFPYLVMKEFLAALLVSAVLMVWSLGLNAPLLGEADPGKTENLAKAPWYFVGLQELLVYFDPWIAGVMIPTVIMMGLIMIPYLDTSRAAVGEYTWKIRRFALGHFVFGFALWWVLIGIGQYLRGPDWQFYWPWQNWSVARSVGDGLVNLPWWMGLPLLGSYFALGLMMPRRRWPWLYRKLGRPRYAMLTVMVLCMYGVPIKIALRLLFGVKYVLVTPWFNV